MSGQDERVCARPGCDITYVARTHNQIYHDAECCRIATNARLKEKYHERRAQKMGKVRICTECGVTRLSRYNDTKICEGCRTKSESKRNQDIRDILSNVMVK